MIEPDDRDKYRRELSARGVKPIIAVARRTIPSLAQASLPGATGRAHSLSQALEVGLG